MGLSFVGLVFLMLGLFTKELAGLEQMLLFQTIFASLLFSPDKVTLPVLSLSGFRYSLGVGLPHSRNMLASSLAYLLKVDGQTLASCYIINFLFYLLPLGALLWLLYRLRNKNFPYKVELTLQSEEYFRGELLLYISLFNLFPLIIFSKLFITLQSDFYFWDLLLAVSSILLTLWALYNYCFHPEIVGIFRSAFRSFSHQNEQEKSRSCETLTDCLCQRFCEGLLGDCYSRYISNHYFLFIGYMIISSLVIILAASNRTALSVSQLIVLLVLLASKPYFNKAEKFRSILMFCTLLVSNFISFELGGAFTFPFLLIGLCFFHSLISIYVLIVSFIEQLKRRFNDCSQIVKKMCREQQQLNATNSQEKEQIQKETLKELIVRFNKSHNTHLYPGAQNSPNSAEISNLKDENLIITEAIDDLLDNEDIKLKEQIIIDQENKHIRYQRGLKFFDKYGKELEKDLIKEHYDQI